MSYFRNIQTELDGSWLAGGTYTFEVWYRSYISRTWQNPVYPYNTIHETKYYSLVTNTGLMTDASVLFPDNYMFPNPMFNLGNGEPNWTGYASGIDSVTITLPEGYNAEEGCWALVTVVLDEDAPTGNYRLVYTVFSSLDVESQEDQVYTFFETEYSDIGIVGPMDPPDNSTVDVSRSSISWTVGTSPYNVYFNGVLVSENQIDTFWNLPELEYGKEYTWSINDEGPWTFWTMPFYIPKDRATSKRLVAVAANKFWYENV